MRKTLPLGALIALGLATWVTFATAASSPDRGKRVHVLHMVRDVGNDVFLDLDHSATGSASAPDSVGDADAYTADLFAKGEKIGIDGGLCVLVRLPAIYHCVATNQFADGQITVQFLQDATESFTGRFAITGGTGAYRGAQGVVTFVDHPGAQRDDVTFRFTTR
jgi:hypothetical protein